MRQYKIIYLLTIIQCFSLSLWGADSLRFLHAISVSSKYFSVDITGNIFIINQQNSCIKYNPKGDSIGIFNEIRKGQPTLIDVTNPMRVLLYYANFNRIDVLDNMLSKKNTIALNNLGLTNISCIANSVDGSIWIYNTAAGALQKINDKQEITYTTAMQNIMDDMPAPSFMIEQDRQLLMCDTLHGIIHKFDLYGFYITSYHIAAHEIQYINGQLLYYHFPHLYSYHTQTTQTATLSLPMPTDILQIRLVRNKVYIRREKSIDVYEIQSI